jgi:tetratricopeptide (TPR) repeat protein
MVLRAGRIVRKMLLNATASIVSAALVCLAVAPAPASNAHLAGAEQSAAPSDAELKALGDRIINALHNNDTAMDEYERIEHHAMVSGSDRHVVDDKTFRVVPTGTGTLRLLVKENGKPVDAEIYQKQLRDWEQVLEIAVNPKDSRQQAAYGKWQKKMKERRDAVEAARQAFHTTWAGRETRNGRSVAVLALEPNPSYVAQTMLENVLTHTRMKIWVDEASGNIVHADAEIIRDVPFGGGLLGKLYRGARFSIDTAEIAHGFWAPTRVQYDYTGRKFLFVFEAHEVTETTRYRRDGPPAQALALVRDELAHGAAADP